MLTIAEILQQVHDLVLQPADALPLVQQHVDAAYNRAAFARAAMTGMLATGIRHPSTDVFAAKVFELADCMVAAAAGITPEVAATAAEVRL